MNIILRSKASEVNSLLIQPINNNTLNDKFTIQGLKTGEYSIIASLKNYKSKHFLYSNVISLTIFPKLKSVPDKILISPGCETILQLLGGPQVSADNVIILHINENPFALKKTQINSQLFKLKGLSLSQGTFNLIFSVYSQRTNQTLTLIKVSVVIAYPETVAIEGIDGRKLIEKAMIRLHSKLYYEKQLFTTAICPFEYNW